jgi:hypothetical protein
MTTEAPVHRCCADRALAMCPHLRGREQDLERFPAGWSVLSSIVGGAATETDFTPVVKSKGRIVGHLKFAWPANRVEVRP